MNSNMRSKTPGPLQGDLFSGRWLSTPPKRGDGKHIRYKPPGEAAQVVVPGMADSSGGGSDGTYCQDCEHRGGEIAVQTAMHAIEVADHERPEVVSRILEHRRGSWPRARWRALVTRIHRLLSGPHP